MFEIGSPATASGVVSADVNLGSDEEADYEEEDKDYDLVTPPLVLEDLATTSLPYKASRRGDTDTHNDPSVRSPHHGATESPPGPSTERTRSFQLPAEKFPQQHPQVIDVDEVEETGVGKIPQDHSSCTWTLGFPEGSTAGGCWSHALWGGL